MNSTDKGVINKQNMKNMKNKFILSLISSVILSVYMGCSMSDMAGTGSQAGNGMVVGTVLLPDGSPAAGAELFIRTESFLKDTSYSQAERVPDAVTNSTGAFAIDSVNTGNYFIEINDGSRNAVLVKCNINTFIPGVFNLDTVQLQPSAGFYGMVDRKNIPVSDNIYIQVYGLDRVQSVDTSGEFIFGGLPAGTHIIRAISSNPSHGILEADTITVDPAENRDAGTFLLPFEFWRDTVVVRRILDTNGLVTTPVSEVVSIGKQGRVFDMNLTNRSILILPPTVGELRLRNLRLGSNVLDSLPDEIGKILSLKHLVLQRNQLVYIPESIGNLTHLEHLDISGNKLTTLPESIVNLTNLDFLTVIHNKLHSVPPPIKIWLDTYSFEKNWQELQDP